MWRLQGASCHVLSLDCFGDVDLLSSTSSLCPSAALIYPHVLLDTSQYTLKRYTSISLSPLYIHPLTFSIPFSFSFSSISSLEHLSDSYHPRALAETASKARLQNKIETRIDSWSQPFHIPIPSSTHIFHLHIPYSIHTFHIYIPYTHSADTPHPPTRTGNGTREMTVPPVMLPLSPGTL